MPDPTLSEVIIQAVEDMKERVSVALRRKEEMERAQESFAEAQEAVKAQSAVLLALSEAAKQFGLDLTGMFDIEPASEPETDDDRWRAMARTDAIMLALKHLGAPVSPKTITAYLRNNGRAQDSPGAVSATLGHLAEYGKVVSVGRGQWVVSHQDSDLAEEITDDTYQALIAPNTQNEVLLNEDASGQ